MRKQTVFIIVRVKIIIQVRMVDLFICLWFYLVQRNEVPSNSRIKCTMTQDNYFAHMISSRLKSSL